MQTTNTQRRQTVERTYEEKKLKEWSMSTVRTASPRTAVPTPAPICCPSLLLSLSLSLSFLPPAAGGGAYKHPLSIKHFLLFVVFCCWGEWVGGQRDPHCCCILSMVSVRSQQTWDQPEVFCFLFCLSVVEIQQKPAAELISVAGPIPICRYSPWHKKKKHSPITIQSTQLSMFNQWLGPSQIKNGLTVFIIFFFKKRITVYAWGGAV